MSRRIITFLILLPLAILISLPCPIKQDIKQLLSIPINASVQIDKSNKNYVCVYAPAKNKKSERKQQKTNIKYLLSSSISFSIEPTDNTQYQKTGLERDNISSIPIFLVHRKLII